MAVKYAAPCAFVGRVGNKVPKKPATPIYSEQKGSTFSQNSLHFLKNFFRTVHLDVIKVFYLPTDAQ
jgi:hypothetical protein